MSHGVSRVDEDRAGGLIIEAKAPRITVNGRPIALEGAAVQPHMPFHLTPHMAEGESHIRANGIPVVREGHKATCGHAATGDDHVRIL